jgi:pSer/pThr/pTyr-binding forkhead associated (FHA) protein
MSNPASNLRLEGERGTFPLDLPLLKIGRLPSCQIQLDHLSLSREHAQITIQNNRAHLTDNNSANGTKVNGKKLSKNEQVQIQAGDQIIFGKEPPFFVIQNSNFGNTPKAPQNLGDIPLVQSVVDSKIFLGFCKFFGMEFWLRIFRPLRNLGN